MEIAEDLNEAQVGTRVVNDSLRTVLDQVPSEREVRAYSLITERRQDLLKEHEGLVDLSPLPGLLLGEPSVDARHNLVEQLAVDAAGELSVSGARREGRVSVQIEGTAKGP